LVGSYDNTVQLWNTKGERLNTFNGHTGAVKSVCWISEDENRLKFLSTSHDQSVLLWHVNKKQSKVEKITKCIGHTESVECVDVNTEKTKFLSSSWDKMLKLWTLS
jgi:ribosome biogenesis protein YTM1